MTRRQVIPDQNIIANSTKFTRLDCVALRFLLNRAPIEHIMFNVYGSDALDDLGIETAYQLQNRLEVLMRFLGEKARAANPHVSEILLNAQRQKVWTQGVINFVIKAGEGNLTQPQLDDQVGLWFNPGYARLFKNEGLDTLRKVIAWIELRGTTWYRPIPRLGPGRAAVFINWLERHRSTLGAIKWPTEDIDTRTVEIKSQGGAIVSVSRISGIHRELNGECGLNRAEKFCFISAKNDLEAIRAYLLRFVNRDKTHRAYSKEIERFFLWCLFERKIALSSALTSDCDAYKAFIADLPDNWRAPKTLKSSYHWRPFTLQLQPNSQKYAIQVLRTFFDWLVKVRYLGGNPWFAITDPITQVAEVPIAIGKAWPKDLWEIFSNERSIITNHHLFKSSGAVGFIKSKSNSAKGVQFRIALAATLILGFTGIRREELAFATMNNLSEVSDANEAIWELKVLGKRNKWRSVYLPNRVIFVLREHWLDRGEHWNPDSDSCLLSPLVLPNIAVVENKHNELPYSTGNGFSPDGLYVLMKRWFIDLAKDSTLGLTLEHQRVLQSTTPHALRHTFGTHAAKSMPVEIVQKLLGHSSIATTTLYVNAHKKESLKAVTKYFAS